MISPVPAQKRIYTLGLSKPRGGAPNLFKSFWKVSWRVWNLSPE